MKKRILFFLLAVALIFCYLKTSTGIQLINQIPEIFISNNQNIDYVYKNGMTFLKEGDSPAYPIIHDNEQLYILNGAGYDFTKYYIDDFNQEIVIKKNIISPKIRDSIYFQLITIPNEEYIPIIKNQQLKIRVSYIGLNKQSLLLEYNVENKKTEIVSHTLVGK